jgi:hypothetical protein
LRSPDLLARVASDFSRCGIVGERSNALVGYLAAISRKLDRPLAVLIQSTSAAGKSSLLDAVLRFVPEEDRIVYSAMTGLTAFDIGDVACARLIRAAGGKPDGREKGGRTLLMAATGAAARRHEDVPTAGPAEDAESIAVFVQRAKGVELDDHASR